MFPTPAPPAPPSGRLLPPPGGPPAGWYPDPSGSGLRYFDGRQWAFGPALEAPVERPPYPSLPILDAVIAVVILAASLVVEKLAGELLADRDMSIVLEMAIGLSLAYGPSVWWCSHVARREQRGPGDTLGWRAKWIDLGWGPLLFVGALIGESIVVQIATRLGVPFESNVDRDGDVDRTAAYVTSLVFATCVAAPLVEEAVFRGVVLRGLASRLGVVLAVFLQGLLFGAAHIDPSRGAGNLGLALGLSAVGCAFGLVTVLTRRLGSAILAHAMLNGMVVTLLLTGVLDELERDFESVLLLLR